MQRGRPATSAAARSTASSSKAGGGTTGSARARATSEKAAPVAGPTTARVSKVAATKSKAPAVVPTPATRKRAPSSTQSKAGPAKAAAPANNQEEQPQQDEDNDADHGAADAMSVSSISNASDAATVGWLIGSDYRLATAVRVRPMLPAEKKKGYRRIVDMAPPDEGGWTRIVNPVALTSPLSPPPSCDGDAQVAPLPPPASKQFTHEFAFDYSFWSYDHAAGRQVATQGVVYESLGGLAIETVLQGSNCAILAYGQSGTGKTFTMTGGGPVSKAIASTAGSASRGAVTSRVSTRASGATAASGASTSAASRRGLTPRICRGLFDRLEELQQDFGDKSAVHVSFVEVYNEKVFDLLLPPASAKRAQEALKVREHPEQGTYVENARQVKTVTFDAVQALLEEGNRQRSVASTTANGRSSRSHAVLTLTLTHQTPPPLSAGKEGHSATVKKSKLYLVDLAGSERADAIETDNSRQRETSNINRSLATLADVICALAKRGTTIGGAGSNNASSSIPFVPYRNSVLTRLLKESLGGDATTILLATISPCCAHFEDTLSTLKFVGRTKNALSVPRLPSPSPSMLEPALATPSVDPGSGLDLVHELRKEILELREKLEAPPPASETRRPSFPLALSWESPSPGAVYSCPESAFTDPQSTGADPQSASLFDAVADATRWALQYAPSPMVEEASVTSHQLPSSSPPSRHSKLDENEKERLEDEVEELRATLSRKEYEFECQRVTTRALQDRVAAQILSQHLILTNLLSIRRRWLQLQAMRAFQRWRTSAQDNKLREGSATAHEHAEIQTDSISSFAAPKKTPSPAVQLDALCHSVVDDFVFTAEEQALKNDLPLENTSQLRAVDYDEAQQQAMDCNTLSIIIDGGFDEIDDLEGGSPPEEAPEEDGTLVSASSISCADSFDVEKQHYIDAKLASCLDSLDLARKAMGPTLHRLRQLASVSGIDSAQASASVGVERSLLVNLDKRLAALAQVVEAMRDGLAQRNLCTVNHGVAAAAVFELMEALLSAFCLHMLGRMNDQLVSGVSGCALGRQEIETQLRAFREQLAQLLQLANAVMARGELHPRDHDATLFLVMELVGICERIECVWLAIEQRKRHQLANQRVATASRYEAEQLSAKLRHMETNSRSLSESLDAQVLETARVEDELAASLEQLRTMEEAHASQVAVLEIQLAECEARASEFEKRNVEVTFTTQTQSSKIEQLEHQLAELKLSFQALHEAQDGATANDESSPITLRCGNLMVRLEEELTSALCRMNAMEPVSECSEMASPLASTRASPSASPLMKEYNLQLAAINSELSELAATTPMEQSEYSPSRNETESSASEGGVGELKTDMERDLFTASTHEQELEVQLAEALGQVCHLQAEHEALMRSVHSLNAELSEALGRVASLEDERSHQSGDSEPDNDSQADDRRLMTLADAQSALVELDFKFVLAMSQGSELSAMRCRLEASEAGRETADTERASLACQVEKEQAHCQELTRQVEAAVEHLTELRGQAGTLRSDLESALNCKQQWEAQTQENDAVIVAQAAQLSQLNDDMAVLEAVLDDEKHERSIAIEEAERQIHALREEIRLLTEQTSVLKLATTGTEASIQQYEARIGSLEALVAAKTSVIETLSEQLDRAQADAHEKCDSLSQTLSAKTSEAIEAKQRNIELLEELKSEREQLASLQAELKHRDETVEAQQKELEAAQHQASLTLKDGDEAMAKLRAEIEVSSEAAQVLRDQLRRIDEEHVKAMGSAKQQIADLHGEIDLLRFLLRQQQDDIVKDQAERDVKLNRAEEEHTRAMGSAEQQIADLQGETDLLRLLLRKQQDDTVKNQAEREEMQSTLDDAKTALATAVAQLEQADAKLTALERSRTATSAQVVKLEAHRSKTTQQLVKARKVVASSSAWKHAWSCSIVQCGSLKLQLKAEAIERRRLEETLLRQGAVVVQLEGELEVMTTELGRSEQANEALNTKCAKLTTEMEQHRDEVTCLREQTSSLGAHERQREAVFMELQLLHDLTQQEKRKLQVVMEQTESTLRTRIAEYEAAEKNHAAQTLQIEVHFNERVEELRALLASQTTDANGKEAELLESLRQANALVEELNARVLELGRQLESERESVQALRLEIQTSQATAAEREASIRGLEKGVASSDSTIAVHVANAKRTAAAHQALMEQCTRQDRKLSELNARCLELGEQTHHVREWRQAWVCSIVKCGALQLQAKVEKSELNEALVGALSRMKLQDTEVTLLRSELQRAITITSRLETARAELQAEFCQRVFQLSEAQEEIRALTHCMQHSESELLRAEQNLQELGEEKCSLEEQIHQIDSHMRELESRHDSKEQELEQALASAAQSAADQDAMWEAKEATLKGELSHQSGLLLSLNSRHEEVVAQFQALRGQCSKLQGDLAAEKLERQACEQSASAVATAAERTTQRLREVEATAFMQLADLESFRWWVATEHDRPKRRSSAELLDQAVAAYSLEPSEAAKQAVMRHLSSLDEWFERTIVAGLADDIIQTSLDVSPAIQHVENVPSPSLQVETVNLDALTNELLDLCSTSDPCPEPSRTDTLEAIRVLSATEAEEDDEEEEDDEKETTVATEYEFEDVFGVAIAASEPVRLSDNNAGDSSDSGVSKASHDTVRTAKVPAIEPETSDVEVAQLKSTIWRLKEALDAKDDMLGFMDAKLIHYEQLLGKHQAPSQQRRSNASMGW